jgi:hypothetical protein
MRFTSLRTFASCFANFAVSADSLNAKDAKRDAKVRKGQRIKREKPRGRLRQAETKTAIIRRTNE